MELPRPLLPQESDIVNVFKIKAEQIASTLGIGEDWSIAYVANEASINLWDFPKEGVVIQAFWISLLNAMRKVLDPTAFKYPDVASFQSAYHGNFDHHSSKEINNLWETANWMALLFTLIPSKKNKGLALAVVPKFVEGWYAKYVTGSGQTKATAERVKIFETEGSCLPNHRGTGKSKKRTPVKKAPNERVGRPSNMHTERTKVQKENKNSSLSKRRSAVVQVPPMVRSTSGAFTRSSSGALKKGPPGSNIYSYFGSYQSFVNVDDLDNASELGLTDEDQSSEEESSCKADEVEIECTVEDDVPMNMGGGGLASAAVRDVSDYSSSSRSSATAAESFEFYCDDEDMIDVLKLFRSTSAPSLSRMSSVQSTFSFPLFSRVSSDECSDGMDGQDVDRQPLTMSCKVEFTVVPNDVSIEMIQLDGPLSLLPPLCHPDDSCAASFGYDAEVNREDIGISPRAIGEAIFECLSTMTPGGPVLGEALDDIDFGNM